MPEPAASPCGAGETSRVMILARRAPHGASHAREALEVALAAGGYELELTLAFVDDGVWQLVRGQDTSATGTPGFAATWRALPDFGVGEIYVEQESLAARGLDAAELVVAARSLPAARLREIMQRQHWLLSF